MEAEVKQHPQRGKGHALVTLTGGGLPSANVRFIIHRAGSRDTVLGPQGWQASETWLVPQEFEGGGDRLLLTLGPEVVNHMDNANYLIGVTGDQVSEPLLTGLAWLDIAPADVAAAIRRSGVAVLEDRSAPPAAPGAVSVTVVLQQPPAPEPRRSEIQPPAPPPPPPPPPPPKPWLRRVAAVIVLLLLLGGVTWKFLMPPPPNELDVKIKQPDPPNVPTPDPDKPAGPLPPLPDPARPAIEQKAEDPPKPQVEPQKPDQAQDVPKPTPPAPAPPVPGPTVDPQTAARPPLELARGMLREYPQSPEQWVALGDRLRSMPEGADAAFLLYRNAGTRGHGGSALQVGGYYDPQDAGPKGTIAADAVQAYLWYKRAAEANVAEAPTRLQRLREWAERQSAAGNTNAKEALEQWK